MSWTTTYSGACDYADTEGFLGAIGTLHRSGTTAPPPLWCELPFEHVADLYCDRVYDEDADAFFWDPPLAGTTRIVGVRDDQWHRQIYKVDKKWIARVHKVYFRRCRLFHHRVIAMDDTAYSGKLWLTVQHVQAPAADEVQARWNVCAGGYKTIWRASRLTYAVDPAYWQAAMGKYDIRPMSVYTPGYAILTGGDDNLDETNRVDLLTWREVIQLDETKDAYFSVDLDWYHAWRNDQPTAGRPDPSIGADAQQASPFYIELDAAFDPAWILGRDQGDDSIATS